jgi:hypothetical protein
MSLIHCLICNKQYLKTLYFFKKFSTICFSLCGHHMTLKQLWFRNCHTHLVSFLVWHPPMYWCIYPLVIGCYFHPLPVCHYDRVMRLAMYNIYDKIVFMLKAYFIFTYPLCTCMFPLVLWFCHSWKMLSFKGHYIWPSQNNRSARFTRI